MKNKFLLSLLLVSLFACRDNIDEQIETKTYFNPPVINLDDFYQEVIPVSASLAGVVIDENGMPVSDADITLDDESTTSDEKGRFVFRNIAMNKAGTFVLIEKDGYFNGSSRFFPRASSMNYVTIKLLDKTPIGTFSAEAGATVQSSEGISITFPAQSIITAAGAPYTGNVNVAARWLNPTAQDLGQIMPGDLQGVNRFNEEVALSSFGMMAVELTDNAGNELNIGQGRKAELTFPVPAELLANAPNEIPLWYFNETYGLWQEEGIATLQGGYYIGEVNHFSFWNCDIQLSLVTLEGQVETTSGIPISNAYVSVEIVGSGSARGGWTDDEGYFGGKVPSGEELAISISSNYGCEIFSTTIGPLTADHDMGVLSLVGPELIEISGSLLDCDNEPLYDGWVEVTLDGHKFWSAQDGSSNEFLIVAADCNNSSTFDLVATDLGALEQSDVQTFNVSPAVDVEEIVACGNVLTDYFKITVGGTETITLIQGSAVDSIGSGEFLLSGTIPPGTDNYFYLFFNQTSIGTYDESILNGMFGRLTTNTYGILNLQCWGVCGIDEITFTEISAEGEPGRIKGTFSGTILFTSSLGGEISLSTVGDFDLPMNP
ncbi:MAG TPA: carboxypeptidase-like regulatory domain-containing protein [Saprospiraceae bacterium]|nr:carboxypeptidase-like regulatory domain-containing protein [Saprospiraceae bacterium]